MKVEFEKSFIKKFIERFGFNHRIQTQFKKRIALFQKNTDHPVLKDHQLQGDKRGLRAFSINRGVRIVYYIHNDIAYFIDIGTHEQVY